jgi:hypothetical protein
VLQIFPRLIRSIPELRERRLWHRYFIDKEHFQVDLALSGLALSRLTRRRAPLAMVVPWVVTIAVPLRSTWRIGGLRLSAKYLASKVHAGLGDAVVLAIASIRYRRVVL